MVADAPLVLRLALRRERLSATTPAADVEVKGEPPMVVVAPSTALGLQEWRKSITMTYSRCKGAACMVSVLKRVFLDTQQRWLLAAAYTPAHHHANYTYPDITTTTAIRTDLGVTDDSPWSIAVTRSGCSSSARSPSGSASTSPMAPSASFMAQKLHRQGGKEANIFASL